MDRMTEVPFVPGDFNEFHRGYMGGERNAARKILVAIMGAPIDSKEKLIELIERVCREELDIDL